MPAEALTVAPAAAPAAAPAPSPSPSPSPAIQVTPAVVDKGPQAPPPKGSARERMFQDLRKKTGVEEPAAEPPKPAAEVEESAPTDAPVDVAPTAETPPVAGDKPKGKVSPWKLVDEHKAARLKAETELAELRKTMADPVKVKEIETKAEAAERRAKELEEEIKYVNYSKSQDFQEKYQKPYEAAWQRWMGELGELTVPDPATGNERPIQPEDIFELMKLPLKDAKTKAMESYGDFADDVMSARKELRSMFEAQNKALQDAKQLGDARQSEMTKQSQEKQQALARQVTELWTKSNEMAQSDERFGKYFKPVEGDEEANARLKKGYEIADRAFSVNSLDPNMTPEQRQQAVQLHAAVRNRAAAFGKLVYQNEKQSALIAELKAELGKFKAAQPGAGEAKHEAAESGGNAFDRIVRGGLQKYAH